MPKKHKVKSSAIKRWRLFLNECGLAKYRFSSVELRELEKVVTGGK